MNDTQRNQLLAVLQERFESNKDRHKGLAWSKVLARLEAAPRALRSLHEMESTGGEPDIVGVDRRSKALLFVDCSPETPKGRRSLCYDGEALRSRKEHKPRSSAIELAREMGVELLTEAQYFELQELGEFDLKTSSWLLTPPDVRRRGGALFGDRRYGRVFIYHNGAESYYAVRGFRACLEV